MPGINLPHAAGIGRLARAQRGADVADEGDRRAGRSPDAQHQSISAVRVAEAMPLPAGATNIDPAAASCGPSSPATSSRPCRT